MALVVKKLKQKKSKTGESQITDSANSAAADSHDYKIMVVIIILSALFAVAQEVERVI